MNYGSSIGFKSLKGSTDTSTRYQHSGIRDITSFDPTDIGIINISILQMRKLRLREVKELLEDAPAENQ